MADKLDHILSDYFTGQLDINIKLRKLELSYHNSTDENVGGGRMQNNITRSSEITLVKIDSDPQIKQWEYFKQVISLVFGMLPENYQRVIIAQYKYNETWTKISLDECINERTAREWRNCFKAKLPMIESVA